MAPDVSSHRGEEESLPGDVAALVRRRIEAGARSVPLDAELICAFGLDPAASDFGDVGRRPLEDDIRYRPLPPWVAWREHDHAAEDAFLACVEERTGENAHAAELAIAKLQRRYEAVLRRLDGVEDVPKPTCTHDPAATPVDCLDATLFELAGAKLHDRAATLAHGLEALRELERRLEHAGSHTVEDLRRRVGALDDQLEVARAVARALLRGDDPAAVAGREELAWLDRVEGPGVNGLGDG